MGCGCLTVWWRKGDPLLAVIHAHRSRTGGGSRARRNAPSLDAGAGIGLRPDCRENATVPVISVIALLHESGATEQMNELIQKLNRAGKKLVAALRDAGGRLVAVLHQGRDQLRRLATDSQPPLDPLLEENAPQLPGTGNRAFWVGLVVVSLSLVSGL